MTSGTKSKRATGGQEIGQPVPQEFAVDYGVGPGELVRAELDARGLSQAQLAARTGLSTKHINQVLQGVVPLSTSTAILLERTLGVSAELLMAIEAGHRAALGRVKDRKDLAAFKSWFESFPRHILTARDIVAPRAAIEDQIGQLLAFFGVANPGAFERLYAEEALSFRRAQHLKVNVKATALWLRLAEREASGLDAAPYSRKQFVELLADLPRLTLRPIEEAFPELQQKCAAVGVAVVRVPDVEGARAYAATRWLGPARPVIALTGRGGFEDGFWFTFFHEAGHVVEHPERRSLVHLEGEDGDDMDGGESDANAFAKRILLGDVDPLVLESAKTVEQVRVLARQLGVHPGIVAGQAAYLQGKPAWGRLRQARRKTPW